LIQEKQLNLFSINLDSLFRDFNIAIENYKYELLEAYNRDINSPLIENFIFADKLFKNIGDPNYIKSSLPVIPPKTSGSAVM